LRRRTFEKVRGKNPPMKKKTLKNSNFCFKTPLDDVAKY